MIVLTGYKAMLLQATNVAIEGCFYDVLLNHRNKKTTENSGLIVCNGGESGIRTLGRDKPTLVFKTSTFGRSVNSPRREIILGLQRQNNSNFKLS
tara:strand:+ start:1292 stop:1576 length:285 start_codon:yes stop_codon:yes gene_type:complete